MSQEPTIFELHRPGSAPDRLPAPTGSDLGIPAEQRRETLPLPEVSELGLVRHYNRLGRLDRSLEFEPQPTGSCTIKYNPKVSEALATLAGVQEIHPYQPAETLQGALAILWQMQRNLSELTGFPGVSLQPAAGAHAMLAGVLMVKAYLRDTEGDPRETIIVTDSAHGSNPATGTMCGYRVVTVRSRSDGCVDLEHLTELLDDRVAALMLTHPNTAGIYEREMARIAAMVHRVGGFLYLDGANMNALAGVVRPADLGVDLMQINLHKTFATPHGGSGPASGPLLCSSVLVPYLPVPLVERQAQDGIVSYEWITDRPTSIGRVRGFAGNWDIILRAYAFMSMLGSDGIVQSTEQAVLNANYLRHLVQDLAPAALGEACAHEFVVSADELQLFDITIEDIAKRLMDRGMHPPLYNFPKTISQAMLIEPTESEGKMQLEELAAALRDVWNEARQTPNVVRTAPHETPVTRVLDCVEEEH